MLGKSINTQNPHGKGTIHNRHKTHLRKLTLAMRLQKGINIC